MENIDADNPGYIPVPAHYRVGVLLRDQTVPVGLSGAGDAADTDGKEHIAARFAVESKDINNPFIGTD
jgi:hypothetical protein